MKASIIALICLTTPALAEDPHGHAMNHHFYMGQKSPVSGISCCNDKDCRPAKHKVTPAGIAFLLKGKWVAVPMATVIETDTPDQDSHWCGIREDTDAPVTFCAILPRGGV